MLTTVTATGPLPDHVLVEIDRMASLVKVNVTLDPEETPSDGGT